MAPKCMRAPARTTEGKDVEHPGGAPSSCIMHYYLPILILVIVINQRVAYHLDILIFNCEVFFSLLLNSQEMQGV